MEAKVLTAHASHQHNQLTEQGMKLNVEVNKGTRLDQWTWRVRSDDTRCGDVCLAVGITARSESDALEIGNKVAEALRPVFGASK